MIIGIGNDIVNITRIEKMIINFEQRFLNKVFTDYEKLECEKRAKISFKERASAYAKRFAVKEACAKALGTGIKKRVFWKDIIITHQRSGKPEIKLLGGAEKRLKAILPPDKKAELAVTISDDYPFAIANVIISAV